LTLLGEPAWIWREIKRLAWPEAKGGPVFFHPKPVPQRSLSGPPSFYPMDSKSNDFPAACRKR